MERDKKVLIIVGDFPGEFTRLAYAVGAELVESGVAVEYAVPTPFYEKLKGVDFSEVGAVHYFSEFDATVDADLSSMAFDYRQAFSTFVRQTALLGKHQNDWESYKNLRVFFEGVLGSGFSMVWSEPPSNSFTHIAHGVATDLGCRYWGYAVARVGENFTIALDEFASELVENPAPQSLSANEPPSYMNNPLSTLHQRSIRDELSGKLSLLVRSLRVRSDKSHEMGRTQILQIRAGLREIRRKFYFRWLVADAWFEPEPPDDSRHLRFLFPLHFRPEASTSVQAAWFEDDLTTIRNLAFSLPHHAKLYVREHPSAIGIRSRNFYKTVLSYPNVVLIGIREPMAKVLSNVDAVVTLTSTVGFDALRRGLPVLLLGRVFYEDFPGVARLRGWDDLPSALATIVDVPGPESGAALDRYSRYCFPGSFNYMDPNVALADNVQNLIKPLMTVLADGRQ